MMAATAVQVFKSCRTCFKFYCMFYCMFYFTSTCGLLLYSKIVIIIIISLHGCVTGRARPALDKANSFGASFYIKTRNTLDCDESNYSSRIVFSYTPVAFGPT